MLRIKNLAVPAFLLACLAGMPGVATNGAEQPGEAAAKTAADAWIYASPMLFNYRSLYQQTQDKTHPNYIGAFNRFRHYDRLFTPKGPFDVVLRMYGPSKEVQEGTRAVPAVERTDAGDEFQGGFPTLEGGRKARAEADYQRAITAYRFWFPTVSIEGLFHGNREAGFKDNEAMPILSAGPRHLGFTLNSDTPYGGGVLDLKEGPMVVELPPGPLIGLADDHHQRWIKGKPFRPDARMKALLVRAAKAGRMQLLVSAFACHRPDRIAWKNRRWEWVGLIPDSADFETRTGLDLEARDRWFAQAIAASPAMFRRKVGAGSLYWLGHRDKSGTFLDGGKTYRLTVPHPVPADLFWSVTVYDAATRSQIQTDQGKAALRSLFELKDLAREKSVDLYFGPKAPKGKEGQWIQTAPGKGWFTYFRIYGPQKAAFDGSWQPGDFEEVK